jgi:hypothetical protein
MLRQLFPLLEQVLKTAQPPTLATPPQSQQLGAFRVKIQYEDDIKRIEGTRAQEYNDGRLVIFDGDRVVARFNEKVERWWKDSTLPEADGTTKIS